VDYVNSVIYLQEAVDRSLTGWKNEVMNLARQRRKRAEKQDMVRQIICQPALWNWPQFQRAGPQRSSIFEILPYAYTL